MLVPLVPHLTLDSCGSFVRSFVRSIVQMMVRSVCGNIHTLHYREWRQRGVAFEFGDQTYTVPNRTMGTYAAVRACVRARVIVCGVAGCRCVVI